MLGLDREDILVLMGGADPLAKELDPAQTTSGSGGYAGLLYSGLVQLSPDLQVAPDLAESWTVSRDGTVYTFTLKTDAYFSSGRPITAADFKFSWERAADPKTESTTAETYLGDILGFKEKLAGEAEEVAGIQVIDELTLQVTLDGPKPYFLAKLTYPTSYVLDQASVQGSLDDWAFQPNASGPFRLLRYVANSFIAFEPNPGHPEPGKAPAIVFRFYLPGKPLDYYQQGEIDMAYVGDPEDIRLLTNADHELHAELQSTTSLCTSLVQFNNTRPPMDDPNVRAAFAMAIDRQKLLDQFSEATDLLAETILPPAMPGFSGDLLAAAFDPQAAQAALAASKYGKELPPVKLVDAGYAGEESDYINALISMWEENLGLQVELELVDPEDITHAAQQADGHLVSYGWCADYPDRENFLDVLYHSESRFNVAEYENAELDALLEQARTEIDAATRLSLYRQAEELLLSDHAVIPLQHHVLYRLAKPYLKGYAISPSSVRVLHLVELAR